MDLQVKVDNALKVIKSHMNGHQHEYITVISSDDPFENTDVRRILLIKYQLEVKRKKRNKDGTVVYRVERLDYGV